MKSISVKESNYFNLSYTKQSSFKREKKVRLLYLRVQSLRSFVIEVLTQHVLIETEFTYLDTNIQRDICK